MNLSPTIINVLSILAVLLLLLLTVILGCRWFNEKAVPLIQQMEDGEPPPGLPEALKEEGGDIDLDAEDDSWWGDEPKPSPG